MSKLEDLIRLRDAVASPDGQKILGECRRFMVEVACRSNSNAEWIKGMGLLIGQLDTIEDRCRKLNEEVTQER